MKNLKNLGSPWTYAILLAVVACALFLMSRRAEGYDAPAKKSYVVDMIVRGQLRSRLPHNVPVAGNVPDFTNRVRFVNVDTFPDAYPIKVVGYMFAQADWLKRTGLWTKLPISIRGGYDGADGESVWGKWDMLLDKLRKKGIQVVARMV